MSREGNLGYETVSIPRGGAGLLQAHARFICTTCGKFLDIPMSGGKMAPEMVVKRARMAGWDAKAHKQNCYCREHANGFTKNDVDSAIAQFKTKMNGGAPPLIESTPLMIEGPTTIEGVAVNARAEGAATPVVTTKKVTQEQRLRIREMLDRNFDDKTGEYLEGFSDKRIAELVGVPEVAAEAIREAAYGPILVDTEIVKLRGEVAALRAEVDDLQTKAETMRKAGAALASRIEAHMAQAKGA